LRKEDTFFLWKKQVKILDSQSSAEGTLNPKAINIEQSQGALP